MKKTLLRSLLLSTIAIALCACGDMTCDDDHTSAALARSVSQAEWARLFAEAEAVVRNGPHVFENVPVKTQLPGFDISPLTFVDYSSGATIKLAGCFDHGVYLSLNELNTPQGNIELSWGEGPEAGSEVLWSRRSAP